jgi:hypothetical protein
VTRSWTRRRSRTQGWTSVASREPLAVWLYGTRIATLHESSSDKLQLHWTDEAYERWGGGSRVMSHLLPLSVPTTAPHPARVKVFIVSSGRTPASIA